MTVCVSVILEFCLSLILVAGPANTIAKIEALKIV